MLNETSIRCFLTVAQTLSFTETAKVMYMTQQSVSKYIAKLEEDLGFQLFIRSHHYVMLTKAGENFYNFFSEANKKYSQVLEETRQYYNNMYNSLHIGYLEWLEISSSISKALKMVKEGTPELKFDGEKHQKYERNALILDRIQDLIIPVPPMMPPWRNSATRRSSRRPPAGRPCLRARAGPGASAGNWGSHRRRL